MLKNISLIALLFLFAGCQKEYAQPPNRGIVITTLYLDSTGVSPQGKVQVSTDNNYRIHTLPDINKPLTIDTKYMDEVVTVTITGNDSQEPPKVYDVKFDKKRYIYFTVFQHKNGKIDVLTEAISRQ